MEGNKLHSVNISQAKWRTMFWALVIIGGMTFSVAGSELFIPAQYLQQVYFVLIGGLLLGFGFGLVCARVFNIKGVDY